MTTILIPETVITQKIFVIRDQNVMLDSDLAELYQVDTKRLNEQVKRNPERFPPDFMFQLNQKEWNDLKSQFATSSWGGRRTLPYVFTEHGVLMLSSVLSSKRAIAVNIQIMRVYMKIRELISENEELLSRVAELEDRMEYQDEKIYKVFQCLQDFAEQESEPRPKVGYK